MIRLRYILLLFVILSSGCISVKTKITPLRGSNCTTQNKLNATAEFKKIDSLDWLDPAKKILADFVEENTCLNLNKSNSPEILLTFNRSLKRPERSIPLLLYDAVALITLYTIIPTYVTSDESIELIIQDLKTGEKKVYFSEVKYSQFMYLYVIPIIPFQEFKSESDVTQRLILDLIAQAKINKALM